MSELEIINTTAEEKKNVEKVEDAAYIATDESASPATQRENPFILAEESEEYKRMEREFNDYRKKKVLSRIDGMTVGNPTISEIKEQFKSASLNRARVVVMPRLVQAARKELPQVVRVETLVNYPIPLGSKKAVLCEIKAALRSKVQVCAGVNLSLFASGNRTVLERELKGFKRRSFKGAVSPMFSVEGLRGDQLAKLAGTVKNYKFQSVKIVYDGQACSLKAVADAVKIFYDILGEQCPVHVAGRITAADEVEALFLAGAERIITTDYLSLSRAKLDNVTV